MIEADAHSSIFSAYDLRDLWIHREFFLLFLGLSNERPTFILTRLSCFLVSRRTDGVSSKPTTRNLCCLPLAHRRCELKFSPSLDSLVSFPRTDKDVARLSSLRAWIGSLQYCLILLPAVGECQKSLIRMVRRVLEALRADLSSLLLFATRLLSFFSQAWDACSTRGLSSFHTPSPLSLMLYP